jgi:RNA-directed DNA polymerase
MRRESHVRFSEGGGVGFPSATRLVILSRGYAAEALAWTDRVMTRLGLSLNRTKTCGRDARQERFDFLG